MDEILNQLTGPIAFAAEVIAAILIAYGAAEALTKVLGHVLHSRTPVGWRKEMFVRFGVWLLLGLQFALAADIVHSLGSPTWEEMGQLAAIAVIRTFLNVFLEKDISEAAEASKRSDPNANEVGGL